MKLRKNRKIKIKQKHVLFVLGILLLGYLGVNWFLTTRLEGYLNKKLSESIYQATDNFYQFSFNKLSVSFFTGELSVEDVYLQPDSATFNAWQGRDSLPQRYFDVYIKKIDLKGINLTWKVNYKRLNFDLFEVDEPQVLIYNTEGVESKNKEDEDDSDDSFKTLYEIIQPFFNEISTKNINLRKANIVYSVYHPITPSVYALKDVNFFAHGFVLNEKSHSRGKLLYCDNLDFRVEHPQTVLSNAQLELHADTIRFNTQDSIIQLKGVKLEPQLKLWAKIDQMPLEYMHAHVRNVELVGLQLSYTEDVNKLKARTFQIDSTAIQYYETRKEKVEVKHPRKINPDSLIEALSLYKIISPIFEVVDIKDVRLSRAKLKYEIDKKDVKDTYILERFDASANNFRVDSLSEKKVNTFWYSENFKVGMGGIWADVPSKNHQLKIEDIQLDTEYKFLKVEDVWIRPVSVRSNKDYLSGHTQSLIIRDLSLDKGIDIGELTINSPTVRYTSFPDKKLKSGSRKVDESNVIDLVSPFLHHLSIKRINLNNSNIVFNDKKAKNVYSLQNTTLFINQLFIDHYTRYNSPYLFTFKDFGLSFANFNNYLPSKDYKVQIGKGQFVYSTGDLKLEKVKLIPRKQVKQKGGTYYDFSTPLILFQGVKLDEENMHLKGKSLQIKTPKLYVTKGGIKKQIESKSKVIHPEKQPQFLDKIELNNLLIDKIFIHVKDEVTKDTATFKMDSLKIRNIDILIKDIEELKIDQIQTIRPDISVENKIESSFSSIVLDSIRTNLAFSNFAWHLLDLQTPSIRYANAGDSIDFNTNRIVFNKFQLNTDNQRNLALENFDIGKAKIKIINNKKAKTKAVKEIEKKTTNIIDDYYENIDKHLGKLNLGKFKLDGIDISYTLKQENKIIFKHDFHDVDFNIKDLSIDSRIRQTALSDLSFNLKKLSVPIMDDFYNLSFDEINFSKERNVLNFLGIAMESPLDKLEFAYVHPKNKDWFNVEVGDISVSGIDFEKLLNDSLLHIKDLQVNDVLLENLKNQKIEIEHNIMPMIYNEIHKAPFGFWVDNADVNNFEVIYEELPKKGNIAAKFFIDKLYGNIKNLTNRPKLPEQMIDINAKGRLMGTGSFSAQWRVPASLNNDYFSLSAHLTDFDLTELNQLIQPMAPAKVSSGQLKDLKFHTDATSKGATVDMNFLYNDLDLSIYKNDQDTARLKFVSYFANRLIKADNPNKPNKKPRTANVTLVRDPYHSTFNYFWQILQPPLIESAGISKAKQRYLGQVAKSFQEIKNFFGIGKKKKGDKQPAKVEGE